MESSTCFDVFRECVNAMMNCQLVHRESAHDKEFHFQNWCQERLDFCKLNYDDPRRNSYPDFTLVNYPEGYEIKGLEYPGREADFDANSNVPTGVHNGRTIFYIFGRYPKARGELEYPLTDLIICHGDFLNADHDYVHKNRHVKGFGTYGDIMIRDRKMYAVPTPFHLVSGSTGVATLIVPEGYDAPSDFVQVGNLTRVESAELVAGYSFDLRSNQINAQTIPNPHAGEQHIFKAYRLSTQPTCLVKLNVAGEK